jgi:putative transposase
MTYPAFHDDSHLYFITASVVGWKQLFILPAYSQIILDSLAWFRFQRHMKLFSFVIMPTHVHWIAKPLDLNISVLLQKFGSFTAHEILKRLKEENRSELLTFLKGQRRDFHRLHSVWQDIQAENIFSNQGVQQEMEYIHSNPISKKWALAVDRADYRYSSACFYDRLQEPVIGVDDLREWLISGH